MLLIMSGYPFAGKSTFVEMVDRELFNKPNSKVLLWINPKDFLVPEYDQLDEEGKRNAGISAWECALEMLGEKLPEKDKIIVFDTAAASADPLIDKIKAAKKLGHKMIYVFIASNPKECADRAGSRWIGKKSIDYYFSRYKTTIPTLRSLSDKFIKVSNHGGLSDLEKEAIRFVEQCLI